ncbi:unnamed protein product [Prunus armeniaca]
MEIRYRKAGEKDGNILELITSDAKVVEMVGCMSCNRVLVLYYTNLENSNGNGLGSQASVAWPSLDNAKYNYDANVENDGKCVTWHAFSEPGDADANVEVGNEGENEAAVTENGEVGNEGENEENDAEFVDSDYEFSEQEDEVLVTENVVVGGPSGEPYACENDGPTVQPHEHEKVGPTYEASGKVSSDGANTSDLEIESDEEDQDQGNGEEKGKRKKKKNCQS